MRPGLSDDSRKRRRAPALLAPLFLFASACSSAPAPALPKLAADRPLTVRSAAGLATGTVEAVGGHIAQGPNSLRVTLDPPSARLVSVSTFMPVHGHSSPTPQVAEDAGAWAVTGLIFTMPGLWNVTLDLSVASASDSIEFAVDVP